MYPQGINYLLYEHDQALNIDHVINRQQKKLGFDFVGRRVDHNVIEMQRQMNRQVEGKSKDSYKRVVDHLIRKMRGQIGG